MSEIFNDPGFQRQVILENYKKPSNRGLVEDDSYSKIHMDSESCIDDIHVQLSVKDNIVSDIKFDGEACTISTAAASIMTKLLIGKTVEEALEVATNYHNMIFEKPYDSEALEEANVFMNIYMQPNRIKCATLPWDGIVQLLEEAKNE